MSNPKAKTKMACPCKAKKCHLGVHEIEPKPAEISLRGKLEDYWKKQILLELSKQVYEISNYLSIKKDEPLIRK